ncbi:pyocin knob domain-containing protein [Brevibacterium moorei]|uniref:pyocin knob domain-containing protein n=1 Tax=Brevibacterium moorei TaxID=2968457 RepID=UPI00211CD3EB|nr:pyocin knob domain-containing protein [Brevibacterium sp. 68QC2CO]MCQ9384459.1 pyocin knob domain-containing protein [Brevibacterium sp. 68QC2CO]
MAITKTPRLQLDRWSDGSDPHPNRAEWDAQQAVLDAKVAVDHEVATYADRPATPEARALMWVKGEKTLYRWSGSDWEKVLRVGGVTPSSVLIGGSNGEGSSAVAARADHVHAIPLATTTAHGAMPAADRAALAGATASPTGSKLVQRDGNGRAQFVDPVGPNDAATKTYVDSAKSAAESAAKNASFPRGTAPANIDNAKTPGVYQPAAAPTLANGYPVTNYGTLYVADEYGAGNYTQMYVTDGGTVWVRAFVTNAWKAWTLVGGRTATASTDGLMSAADKKKLDGASDLRNPGALVLRKADASIPVPEVPVNTYDAASKAYVDGRAATGAPSNIVAGGSANVGNSALYARQNHVHNLPLATPTAHGAMDKADKAKLNTATTAATGNALVQRFGSGQIGVPAVPDSANVAASKAYVDSQTAILATPSTSGAMSAADKAKLDAASSAVPSGIAPIGNIVMRDSNKEILVRKYPISGDAAISKDYFSEKISPIVAHIIINSSDIKNGWAEPEVYVCFAGHVATLSIKNLKRDSGGSYSAFYLNDYKPRVQACALTNTGKIARIDSGGWLYVEGLGTNALPVCEVSFTYVF